MCHSQTWMEPKSEFCYYTIKITHLEVKVLQVYLLWLWYLCQCATLKKQEENYINTLFVEKTMNRSAFL